MVDRDIASYRSLALECLDRLEPFSPILRQLLAYLAQGEDALGVPEISKLIERDTIIAGQVLSAANSALYNRGAKVISIERAVARLGVNITRNLLLGLSVNQIWRRLQMPASWPMLRFNAHALATATAADILSSRIRTVYAEGAFIAGLFHDIGHLVIASMLDKHYDWLTETAKNGGKSLKDLEREVLGFDHSELSGDILAHWHLPIQVQLAARFHENPADDPSIRYPGLQPLSAIICAADRFVGGRGISLFDGDADNGSDPLQVVGTTEADMPIEAELQARFDLLQSCLHA